MTFLRPPAENVNWNALIAESAGWLADADGMIAELTGWSPIQNALEPIAGNWMDLKRIGKVYGKSGNALTTIADDLTSSCKIADPYWDGAAAQEFNDYSSRMSRGLAWEGSSGRLIEKGLALAADKLQEAAKAVIDLVKKGLSRIVKVDSFTGILKLAAKFVPFAGTAAAIAEVSAILRDVAVKADALVKDVQTAVDAVEVFIEFCKDPLGFAKNKADEQVDSALKPFTDQVDEAKKQYDNAQEKVQTTKDLITVVDIDRVTHRPDAAYTPGTGEELRQDAL